MPYVLHNNKKLFFLKEWDDERVRKEYYTLLCEQHRLSPHAYLNELKRMPMEESYVADCGAAEGIFSLDIVENPNVKKIYMFESNKAWMESLKMTFEPYMDKVEFVNKYVGGIDKDKMITLDNFFQQRPITYIKADVEGYEEDMIKGGVRTFERVKQALICTYHKQTSGTYIRKFLEKAGFTCEFNYRYILYTQEIFEFKRPYLRRAVIYGYR